MNETTNSALMMVVGIIIAMMLVAFGWNVYNINKDMTARNVNKNPQTADNIQNDEYSKYNNIRVNGAAVVRTIKLLKNHDISVIVQRKDGNYDTYICETEPEYSSDVVYLDLKRTMTDDEKEQAYKECKFISYGSGRYIEQSDEYYGKVIYSVAGAITAIVFNRA